MKLGTWNARSLHRANSFTTAARELVRYKLDWVGVQKLRCDKGGTLGARDCNFFYGLGNEKHQLENGFFYNIEYYQQSKE